MERVLVYSTLFFPDEWLARLQSLSPRLEVRQQRAVAPEDISSQEWREIEVLYTGYAVPDPAYAPALRWIQLDTAGVNHLLDTPVWRSDIPITTLNGVAPSNMAEHTLMLVLAFAHRLPLMLKYQARADWPPFQDRWDKFTPRELGGAMLGIIGYGNIGMEIGRIAQAFGMRVLGMRRGGAAKAATFRPSALSNFPGTEPELMYAPEQLHAMLPRCDYVVLATPHTPATHHLISTSELQAMKPSAVLINVARGGVLDESALIRALQAGKLAGAALDVFEQEPLAGTSPLWQMENVIISPHVAGFTPHYLDRIFELFGANLRRYLAGEPLLNQVDRAQGY